METFYFTNRGVQLFGSLHRSQSAPLGLVFCEPYGEEMVFGYARFARWAKELALEGIAALRFHYRGTGESAGGSGEFTFETACLDTEAAVALLRSRMGRGQVGLFGYRFGGTIAAHVAARVRADLLILWSPVVDPATYAREILRLRLTNELVRQRQDEIAVSRRELVEQLEAGQCVDVLGYDLSPAFYRELLGTHPWREPPVGTRVLWLAREQDGAAGLARAREWQSANVAVDYRQMQEIVFWEQFPPELPARFAAESRGWLRERLEAVAGAASR